MLALAGTFVALQSAAWAQTATRPAPFNTPPVHAIPNQLRQRTQNPTFETTSYQRGNDNDDGTRWQAAAVRQEPKASSSNNAIYRHPSTQEQRRPLPGQLLSQEARGAGDVAETGIPPGADSRGDRTANSSRPSPAQSKIELRPSAGRLQDPANGVQRQDNRIADPSRNNQDPSGRDPREFLRRDKTCDEYRAELLDKPLTSLDVNISALRPSARQQGGGKVSRDWSDFRGHRLATGELVDLHHGYAVVKTADGDRRIPVSRLSDADLAAISNFWRLPDECTLGDYAPLSRCWTEQTFTWKASNLCHKPLYFEDEQLERYGHSAGPVLQPLKSAGHFFVHTLSLPYMTAIHPPNECLYSLGFYRPGDCAPWLIDPVPISLSGATRQAAFVVGAASILP